MRKQNQKVKEEFQSLAAGVWVEPKSITGSLHSEACVQPCLCPQFTPKGSVGPSGYGALGIGETEQDSRSKAWVSLGNRTMEESSLQGASPRETLVGRKNNAAGGVSTNSFLLLGVGNEAEKG